MKTFLLTSLLFLFIFPGYGQIAPKVADIVAEREGDNINIFYNIADKDPNVIYKVRINAALDGKAPVALRSVSGDVGDNVRGGKARYKIVWEALKEVNQVGTAEFFITAEKVPVLPIVVKPVKRNKGILMVGGDVMYDFDQTGLGLTLAYYKRWGGYITFNSNRTTTGLIYTLNYPSTTTASLYIGGGAFADSDLGSTHAGGEIGFIAAIRWFTISLGAAMDFVTEYHSITGSIGVVLVRF